MEYYLFNISDFVHWLEHHEIVIRISANNRAEGAQFPSFPTGARSGAAPPTARSYPPCHQEPCSYCLHHVDHRSSRPSRRRRVRPPTPYHRAFSSAQLSSPVYSPRSPGGVFTGSVDHSPLLPPEFFYDSSSSIRTIPNISKGI